MRNTDLSPSVASKARKGGGGEAAQVGSWTVCVCVCVCSRARICACFPRKWEQFDVNISVSWHNVISAVTQILAVVQTAGERELRQQTKDRDKNREGGIQGGRRRVMLWIHCMFTCQQEYCGSISSPLVSLLLSPPPLSSLCSLRSCELAPCCWISSLRSPGRREERGHRWEERSQQHLQQDSEISH